MTLAVRVGRSRTAALIAIWSAAVVSVVSWRNGSIFDGTVDSVVIAKAALSVAALAAAVLFSLTGPRRSLGLRTTLAIAVAAAVSLLGAMAAGPWTSTLIVIARMTILAAIALVLLASSSWCASLAGILTGMGGVAVVAGVTGLRSYGAEGRLVGGIPQMQANELAGLAALPLVALVVLILRDGLRLHLVIPAGVLAGIVWLTESRSTLAGLVIAVIAAVVVAGRVHWSSVVALLAAIPAAVAVLVSTPILQEVALRGQSATDIATLSARTDAWKVVFGWSNESWERWLGLGLAVKQVAVNLKWRDTQVLDSSWVSLLAQCGVIGAVITAMVLLTVILTAFSSATYRPLVIPLLALLVVRSFTESGLVDSSAPFLLFFTLATTLEARTRLSEPSVAPTLADRGGAIRPRPGILTSVPDRDVSPHVAPVPLALPRKSMR